MKISIQGKLLKLDQYWRIELPILNLTVETEKPLQGLRMLEDKLREHLLDERLQCHFRIGEGGDFYLVTAKTPEVIALFEKNLVDLSKIRIDDDEHV